MNSNRKNDVLAKLLDGISQLTSSEKWQEWLTVQSRFHTYSFNNVLLILGQRPDASRVAGFNAWRKLDRFVKSGEKGVWILAPMTYKVDSSEDAESDTKVQVLRGFKPVPVWDVSQTDGKDLPQVCTRLDGSDDADVFNRLLTVADTVGFTVEDSDELRGEVNGDCNHDLHRIRIRATNSPVQKAKTLVHELAHVLLHEHFDSRPVAELEAESVAFIVCDNLGINSDGYTFGYVAGWAGGGDEAISAIKASGGRIQRAADQILSTMAADDAAMAS